MTEDLEFLETGEYNSVGLYLKDIDITKDYSGTFAKAAVINHLTETEKCRMAGSLDSGDKTIVDNDLTVGRNCLSWIETGHCGFTCRCKLYNKFVQSLETQCVRKTVGNHLLDWVIQKDTKLATARDGAKDRGIFTIFISALKSVCKP